jgi:hypothetical protein
MSLKDSCVKCLVLRVFLLGGGGKRGLVGGNYAIGVVLDDNCETHSCFLVMRLVVLPHDLFLLWYAVSPQAQSNRATDHWIL